MRYRLSGLGGPKRVAIRISVVVAFAFALLLPPRGHGESATRVHAARRFSRGAT